jgi:hypothetical protein
MAKLLAISIVVVPLLIALRAARLPSPRRGVRLTVVFALAFSCAYVIALHFLYIRLAQGW